MQSRILNVVPHIVNFGRQCQIRTKLCARMPVFLVGRQFWQPVLDELQEGLLKGCDGQFIKCSHLNIVKIICTTQQIFCEQFVCQYTVLFQDRLNYYYITPHICLHHTRPFIFCLCAWSAISCKCYSIVNLSLCINLT